MTTQKDKIRARLKKSYYSDLMVLAASQTNIQENYMDVITNISVQFSDILRKNGFIKKLQYDPKKFWNFKGFLIKCPIIINTGIYKNFPVSGIVQKIFNIIIFNSIQIGYF